MRLVVMAMLVACACATPYQQMGFRGGVAERPLGQDRWLVRATGNGFTSRSTIVEYTYRRAAELCPRGFQPIDADRSSSSHAVSFDGGASFQDVSKAEAVLVVQCY